MAILGRTERRLAFAIVLTAVIPLIVSIYFANSLVDRTFAQVFTPELGEHLDQALGVYQDLSTRYSAASVGAFNLHALLGGIEESDTTLVFGTESCIGCHYSAGMCLGFKRDAEGNLVYKEGNKVPVFGYYGNGGHNGFSAADFHSVEEHGRELFDGPL